MPLSADDTVESTAKKIRGKKRTLRVDVIDAKVVDKLKTESVLTRWRNKRKERFELLHKGKK